MATLSANSSVSIQLIGTETYTVSAPDNVYWEARYTPVNRVDAGGTGRTFGPQASRVDMGPYGLPGTLTITNHSLTTDMTYSDTSPLSTVTSITNPVTGGIDFVGISRSEYRSVIRPSALQAAFSTYANFDIWRDSQGVVRHNFDRKAWAPTPDVQPWLAQNTYYVDGTSGADANAGTSWALAKKSISAAITAGNTAAAPYVVYVRAGLYVRAGGTALNFGIVAPTQPCSFIAVGGRVTSMVCDLLTWTLNSGTTYQATRSSAQRAYDTATKTAFGDYTEITKVAALATCQATPGTWYTDGTTVYVNRADGAVVSDANTRIYLTSISGAKCSTSGNTYVYGFDFEGGNQYAFRAAGNASGRVVTESCSFKYVTDTGAFNGLTVQDVAGVAAINCVAAQNPADGFNAHSASGTNPFLLTIGCIGRSNGKTGSTSNNGLTTHDGNAALDISGVYHNNYGANVAIVNANTQLWCVGTKAHDSYGDLSFGGSVPAADYLTDQDATTTMWLDGCIGFGSDNSIYKPQGVINVRGGYMQQGIGSAATY